MKTILKRVPLLLSVFTLSMSVFANTVLTLEDVKNEVLNNNMDVKIQFEKYQQAQKGVGVAFGQFLPGLSVHLINVNTTMAVAQSLVPTPSDWFRYQESQELAVAEKFTTEAVKLNILEGLTNNFINIKHHEATLASLAEEEKVLVQVHADAAFRESQGVSDAGDTFAAKRQLLQHRQQMFQLNNLIAQEKELLMIGLGRRPTEKFTLGDLPAETLANIPADVPTAVELGLARAPEIKANKFTYQAASYSTRAAQWSFVSFNGIGFDYPALIAVERSKAQSIKLQGEKLKLEIENQIAAAYEEVALLDERINLQQQVIETTEEILKRHAELFEGGQLDQKVYLASQRNLMAEHRGLNTLEMERRIKLTNIRRLVGTDAMSPEESTTVFAKGLALVLRTSAASFGKSHVNLSLSGDANLLREVLSVEYSIEGVVANVKVKNKATSFRYYIKMARAGAYKVVTKINLLNGQTVVKTGTLTIR